uniref:WD repeat-containing protein 63 n=3 Tax=Clytia hemisphaerica TaxID=252671 RepID=A0A7M6DQP7_9CNID
MAEETGTPPYIFPIFFTSKTQEIFSCKADEEVTEENPHKIITKEQIQQDFKDRAAISDFHPAKKIVEEYPSDELLIVYDAAFQYGQNFYLIIDEEEKQKILNPPEESGELGENGEEEPEIAIRIGLRTPQPWISMGSEFEVEDEKVVETDDRVKLTITRSRKDFGCPVQFEDCIEDEHSRDIVIDCLAFEDSAYSIVKKEMDVGTQNTADYFNQESQTEWPRPKNAAVQCEARQNTDKENDVIMNSDDIVDFMDEVIPRFELALQQNETFNVFINDYFELGEAENAFGTKSDNHLKEYQSFTDLQFSKNKTVHDIQWHPHIKGVIAVSCTEHMSFYERIDKTTRASQSPSLILIWSFADPIHPLLLLEAPDDILCFKFNPSDPNIVCAGCFNGQIVLWDIKNYNDLLVNHKTHGQGSNPNQNMSNLPSFYNTNTTELSPKVRYCAVSSIENSHRMPITDIQWIPDHIEIGRMGVVLENRLRYCSQIMTASSDGHVLFWDTRASKSGIARTPMPENTSSNRVTTFQHLDLSWKPLLKVTAHRLRGSGECSPVKFIIDEVQSSARRPDIPLTQPVEEEDNNFTSFKKKDEPKSLDNINSKFYVATEDGEVIYLDWKPTKDIDTGKIVSNRPEHSFDAHDSTINTLQKSPFNKTIFLTVGGWTFSIWKDGVTFGPLIQSYPHDCKLTSGMWSPSRPSVFFIGKADGNIDVWDLLDKSHEPFLTQNVSPVPIITVSPFQMSPKQQLLAAGDEVGTLHVMEVPWNLRYATTNELHAFEHYLDREASRLELLDKTRGQNSLPTSIKVDSKAGHVQETEEEWDTRSKAQYGEYLEMEKKLLTEMGLLVESME